MTSPAIQALNTAIGALSAAASACHEREQALMATLAEKDAQISSQAVDIDNAATAIAATAIALNPISASVSHDTTADSVTN